MQSKRSQYLLKTSFWLRCIAVILPLPKWDPNLQFSRQRILQNSFCQSRRQKSRNNHRVIFTTIIFSLLSPPQLYVICNENAVVCFSLKDFENQRYILEVKATLFLSLWHLMRLKILARVKLCCFLFMKICKIPTLNNIFLIFSSKYCKSWCSAL